MKFSDIPGQLQVKDQLRTLADCGRIPHAILLSGREGLGKMMLARAFAQYVHCENPHDGEPCGTGRSCRMHADNAHPYVHYVYPFVKSEKTRRLVSTDVLPLWQEMLARHPAMPMETWLELIGAGNSQPMIYVNDAEEVIRADSFPPFASAWKFFIIWLPERMKAEAANKLLKVIEEPSPGTVFILVCDNELQLLPTIFSRTQRFRLGAITEEEIAGYLRRTFSLDEERARRLAHISEGNLLKAFRLGSHSGETDEFRELYQLVMRTAYAKKPAKLREIGDATAAFGREKIRRFLLYATRMFRENFIYNLRMPQLQSMTPEEEAFSRNFSPFVNHSNIEDLVAETDRARIDIERNANAKVVLFDYFLLIIILLHRKKQ